MALMMEFMSAGETSCFSSPNGWLRNIGKVKDTMQETCQQTMFPSFIISIRLGMEVIVQGEKNGRIRQTRIPRKIIYVSTDDPNTVRTEIAQLPKVKGGYTVLNGCQKAEFIFSPASETIKSFHMTPCRKYLGTCNNDDCSKRYARSIAAIADLTILTRARKFVGEYNSNWGRLIKDFRTIFSDNLDALDPNGGSDSPPILVRDIVEVFGQTPPPFGW
jgi:hypothetical protein